MFCTNCGTKLPDGAKFCQQCGQATSAAARKEPSDKQQPVENKQPAERQQHLLKIVRENQWYLVNPAMKVVIDGCHVYALKNGGRLELPFPAGVHLVEVSCSFRKKVVSVDLSQTTVVKVGFNRITGEIEARMWWE